MSYIVLARKWRPQGFGDLVGQDAVARSFQNALSSGKIVHAYLFSGPRGVGKTSSARILAKALNCESPADHEPCGTCQSCRAITEGASVDVIEIDGASNTSVDSVRELRETVKYAPSSGRYKIYIIDEVHMLSTAAFNALLKTLEEPPSHVVFIFATTEAKKIPATILSRCQHHAFRRITKKEITGRLRIISEKEEINIADGALDMVARAADGSMRDALTLLDQACSFSTDITEEDLQNLLGLPETEMMAGLIKGILSGDIAATLSIIKDLADRGSDLRQMTRELVEQFRNITVARVSDRAEDLLEFSHEDVAVLKASAADISIEQLTLFLSELLRLEGEVRTAVNPRYTMELGLLRTSFIRGMSSIEHVLDMLNREEPSFDSTPQLQNQPGVKEEKKTEDRPAAEERKPQGVISKEEIWTKLLERVDTEDHRLHGKLAEAKAVSANDSEFTIGFNGGMSILADFIKSKRSVIVPLLQDISGKSLKLKILSLPGDTSQKDKRTVKEEVYSEPLVNDAIRIFEGSLLKVRPLHDDENNGK